MISSVLSIGLVLSVWLASCFGGAHAATASHGAPTATRLAALGTIAFGSAVGPDGRLYVTDPRNGQILRVDPATGRFTTFASGLPKMPADWGDGGAFDVAFIDDKAYALVSEVGPDAVKDSEDIDGIYRVDGPHSFKVIADIGAWSKGHLPPTDYVLDRGVQFAMQPYGDGFVVNDGHHNRTLYVTLDGQITQLIQFGDVVPTGLARWGTSIYMAQAGPLVKGDPKLGTPNLEIGQAVQFDMKTLQPVEVAGSIPLPVDVEFGPGRTLYALSQGTHLNNGEEGSPADPDSGALLRVNPDRTTSTVIGGLNLPASVKFIGNTAYVVCYTGEIWKIENLAPQ